MIKKIHGSIDDPDADVLVLQILNVATTLRRKKSAITVRDTSHSFNQRQDDRNSEMSGETRRPGDCHGDYVAHEGVLG